MKITGMTPLKSILEEYPETLDVFLASGFDVKTAQELLGLVGGGTMIQTLLKVSDVSLDLFLYHLEKKILDTQDERKFLLEDYEEGSQLDFYGNTTCPLKFTFKDALEDILKKSYQEKGILRNCYVESGRGDNGFCGDNWFGEDIETFPNMLFSKEFNQYTGKKFLDAMGGKGYFETDFFETVNPKIKEAAILDDQGDFCVYAVMADIFLVDKKQMGGLPIPRTTAELLNPIYKDKIVIFGKEMDEISNASLLYIQKDFGEEGLKQFAANVKCALHGAVMSKTAGSDREEAGGIYLVSGFFANTCVKGDLEILWPDDGCMTLPMYMLVKKTGIDRVQDLVEYAVSDEFANACIKAYTPAVNGNVQSCMPESASLKWLGWDYIRNNDLEQLSENAKKIFTEEWKRLHPGKELVR